MTAGFTSNSQNHCSKSASHASSRFGVFGLRILIRDKRIHPQPQSRKHRLRKAAFAMCRVEERVYVVDGVRKTFEDPFPCHNARRGMLCNNVSRKTIEYYSQPPSVTRDDASSPASYNPPTPTGTGTYLVEKRRPAGVTRRPSTRDGTTRTIKPEIIINIGSKKDKSKRYPAPGHKRTSLGAVSIASSNEVHIDSPGSDASYTVFTGYPEASVSPPNQFSQSPAFNIVTAAPKSHHRHTSSASSFTTSSQPPSLYATSEPDSPSTRRPARYPPTIVHNPPHGASSNTFTPSSPTVTHAPAPSNHSYRIATPNDSAPKENIASDGLFPLDYAEFHGPSSSPNGSFTRAAAPEITDRDADRARQRKLKAEAEKKAEKKRQEEADELLARSMQDQEAKQVRFELGRADARAKERAENLLAESEKRRAEEREEYRQRKLKEQDERAAKDAKKEKPTERNRLKDEVARRKKQAEEAESKVRVSEKRDSRPPTRDPLKRHSQSRRNSITQEIAQKERELLLMETQAQMAREREAAEQRERDERAAFLRQQQETSQAYWSPRRDDRYSVTNDGPGIGRRGSVSSRRNSISSNAPPVGLGRSNSKRVSVHQPIPPANLPPLNTTFPQPFSTRPSSSHHQQPSTPLFSQPPSAQARPSARHLPYSDNPFAQPLAAARHSPPMPPRDTWAARDMREALPRETAPTHHRQPSDDRQRTLRRRGEEVIDRATEDRTRGHDRAKQATRNMGKVVGFEDDYDDSRSENEEDRVAGYGPRLGLGKHGHGHGKRRIIPVAVPSHFFLYPLENSHIPTRPVFSSFSHYCASSCYTYYSDKAGISFCCLPIQFIIHMYTPYPIPSYRVPFPHTIHYIILADLLAYMYIVCPMFTFTGSVFALHFGVGDIGRKWKKMFDNLFLPLHLVQNVVDFNQIFWECQGPEKPTRLLKARGGARRTPQPQPLYIGQKLRLEITFLGIFWTTGANYSLQSSLRTTNAADSGNGTC
ncbi:uncharacterized protein BDR25DRAFT_361579 [Lindgomyces ingoldianus]|uniref:Uncharacterized protein n=1 Tax=Lindgomyces ingoldianus TaxID=673940 RepID=A0ACB6QC78_9PLEO|nr:uncharacterized protein BDR25DRAFT_361579 [Lindgomyces ingoldianus]KAF2464501.1 hypothetical protein BDR25DRAFT_361579 [Lindgomyces ingoldianus]